MNRHLLVCVLVAGAAGCVSWIACQPAPTESYTTRPADGPAVCHFSDLPREVFKGRVPPGRVVTVTYPLRLQPTADPHVYHFHPGSTLLPCTHRVIFADPPGSLPCPLTITGTVQGIDPDGLVRFNNVPGPVVIRSASARPSTP